MLVPACLVLLFAHLANSSPPGAIITVFGSEPTPSATISFSSNTLAPAFVTIHPAVGGSTQIAATAHDNSYANAGGLQQVYRVTLSGLSPATTYTYSVSVGEEESGPKSFTTLSADPSFIPRVIYWGDLGRDGGGQAFPALEAEAQLTAALGPGYGSVGIQAGDFAYDLGDLEGKFVFWGCSNASLDPFCLLPKSSLTLPLPLFSPFHLPPGARGAAFMERYSNISAYLPTFTVIG